MCCWLSIFSLGVALGQGETVAPGDPKAASTAAASDDSPAASYIRPIEPVMREPWIKPGNKKGVNWAGLAWQSGVFLGVQHGFRLATEAGTREAIKGPFFTDWGRSVGNMHGWSDGDPFYVNYVGHPMQGAVAGYIWTHNDRDYLGAEFGRNSYYWMSRLRATAFSWAYSALFEIGPVSEATIGNVQSVYPQVGFVDHVVTPILGMGWMVAEDALDKYLIKYIEARVESPAVRLLTRGVLNPARSWANLMRLKVPWARDDRPGAFSPLLTSYLADQRAGRIRSPQLAPKEVVGEFGLSTVEVAMNFKPQAFLGSGGGSCLGGAGEGAFRLSPRWQFVIDVSGCKMTGLERNLTGDMLTYVAGPRWSAAPTSRWNPYAHFLLGGTKITQEKIDPVMRAALVATAAAEKRDAADDHARYAKTWEANGLTLAAGTGLDYRVNQAFALKLANVEYRRAWLPAMNGREYNSGLAFTMGAVLRVGTW